MGRCPRRAAIGPRAVLGGLAAAILFACSCGDDIRSVRADLAEGCSLTSDCNDPLVCAFGSCHVARVATRDCRAPAECRIDRFHGVGVCEGTDERRCLRNTDCPEPQVCAGDDTCRDPCAFDRDCLETQRCISGTCADNSELVGAVTSAGAGARCRWASECPGTLVCLRGRCDVECVGDRDCIVGWRCSATRCNPGLANDAETTADGGKAESGIYVANAGTQTITVYPIGATGNVAPLRMIAGSNTGLGLPIGLVVDSQSRVYAANRTGGNVTVYEALATGNVAPSRTLQATGMGSPEGLGLGSGDDIFVSTCPGCGTANGGTVGVFHFPANATASDYTIAGASTGITNPVFVARAASGELIVGNTFAGSVGTFAAGATGNAIPIRTFSPAGGGNSQGLAYASGTIFSSIPGQGIALFPATATGTPTASATIAASAMLPIGYPGGVFVDASVTAPVIYLVDVTNNAIYVIQTRGAAPNLSAAAVTTISGAATKIASSTGIFVVK